MTTFALFQSAGLGQLILLVAWLGCGLLGVYVSATKNRPKIEGGLFGLILGPLGVLIAAVLLTKGGAK